MVKGKQNGCITIMIHPFKYYCERYTPAQIFPEGKKKYYAVFSGFICGKNNTSWMEG